MTLPPAEPRTATVSLTATSLGVVAVAGDAEEPANEQGVDLLVRAYRRDGPGKEEVIADWPRLSRAARECALEVFDSAKNLRKILAL